jgi:hypothetical protein
VLPVLSERAQDLTACGIVIAPTNLVELIAKSFFDRGVRYIGSQKRYRCHGVLKKLLARSLIERATVGTRHKRGDSAGGNVRALLDALDERGYQLFGYIRAESEKLPPTSVSSEDCAVEIRRLREANRPRSTIVISV